ncbi:MAG TPA: glycerol-3-phosphate dehydrogenase [Casimicrobiaceae bacterium]|nr:glycerol-3-phosphate dehydrogenase [Casimicrobiaceae bacterium]
MTRAATKIHDLLVIGGGINGTGIARDAAGRGLAVLLAEKDDLAAHTSSWSTKLIHGGLRYLEYFEFRLVAESLREREVLLANAPHIIEPLAFVLPHEAHLRPAWMIRCGLFLYDHLGGRMSLPKSFGVKLRGSRWGAGLKSSFARGFVYADARVDDARLVVLNALDAQAKGADIRVHTRVTGARREDGMWRATLQAQGGAPFEVTARAIVNAAGPWVKDVLDSVSAAPSGEQVRHVKGSHIVVPRIHPEEHAYILQNADKRIGFIIPYQEHYSLIGTTDVAVDAYDQPQITEEEIDYLLQLVNSYLDKPLARADVVWSYSGVRPLHDDGSSDPSAVTRDYVFKVDAPEGEAGPGRAPVLSIFGGKITTYRKLAEAALALLAPYFPGMRSDWTESAPLPGGDLPQGRSPHGDRMAFFAGLCRSFPDLPADFLRGVARRHGTRTQRILGEAKTMADLGEDFGAGLTAREIDYLIAEEWARTADDVLWRRTKCGLPMSLAQRDAVAAYVDTEVGRSVGGTVETLTHGPVLQ